MTTDSEPPPRHDHDPRDANVARLREAIARLERELEGFRLIGPSPEALARRISALQGALASARFTVHALRQSASWRITRPLRVAHDQLAALRAHGRAILRMWTRWPAGLLNGHARRATGRPRFLVMTDRMPTPDQDAGSVRLVAILEILVSLGYCVTLTTGEGEAGGLDVTRVRALGVAHVGGRGRALEHLRTDGASYRYVLLSRPDMALEYLVAVRAYAPTATVVYDTVDLHWVRFEREAAITGDPEARASVDHYRRLERFAVAGADLTLTVTDDERRLLRELQPDARVEVLPTIHAPVIERADWNTRRGLMFIGSFWHRPNEDAVCFFATEVLPLVRQQLPDVEFVVLGSHMTDRVRALASPAVHPIGYVADPAPYFTGCRVFVAPLRFGAGMKGKIGHSMSYGLPVVTTTIGAEGLELRDGDTALVADAPEAFARAVVRLYTDEALWRRMSERSRAHVSSRFSEAAATERLRALFPVTGEAASERRAGGGAPA